MKVKITKEESGIPDAENPEWTAEDVAHQHKKQLDSVDMKKFRIYLDTSVINFLFADDAPAQRDATIEFFENYVRTGYYEVYISNVVIDEIMATPNEPKRQQLLAVLQDYPILAVPIGLNEEMRQLAEWYIQGGAIPAKNIADALHIAVCVVNRIDVLLSWNYRHLANLNRKRKVWAINLTHNYNQPLDIVTPLEAMDEEIA